MAKKILEVDELSKYIKGVLERADHHGENVNEIALTIAGAILWQRDLNTLQVYSREGALGNVLWFKKDGIQYAVSYNHESETIEIRQDSMQGEVLESFTNKTTNKHVKDFFETL